MDRRPLSQALPDILRFSAPLELAEGGTQTPRCSFTAHALRVEALWQGRLAFSFETLPLRYSDFDVPMRQNPEGCVPEAPDPIGDAEAMYFAVKIGSVPVCRA